MTKKKVKEYLMLKLLFENESQEEALKMKDMICNSLKGIPVFLK